MGFCEAVIPQKPVIMTPHQFFLMQNGFTEETWAKRCAEMEAADNAYFKKFKAPTLQDIIEADCHDKNWDEQFEENEPKDDEYEPHYE